MRDQKAWIISIETYHWYLGNEHATMVVSYELPSQLTPFPLNGLMRHSCPAGINVQATACGESGTRGRRNERLCAKLTNPGSTGVRVAVDLSRIICTNSERVAVLMIDQLACGMHCQWDFVLFSKIT